METKRKIERLIIAASIGALAACVLSWIVFYPVFASSQEDTSWRGDGICDVQGCNEPRNCFFTETDDPSSPVTEEFCEFHERELVSK